MAVEDTNLSADATEPRWFSRLKTFQTGFLGLCVVIAIGILAWTGASSLMAFRQYPDEVISVTGAATKLITADQAQWQGSYSRRAGSMADAYKMIKTDEATVRKSLALLQILPTEMAFEPVQTNTIYAMDAQGHTTNTIEAYELTQSVKVSSSDVNKIDQVARQSSELIAQGLYFTSNDPEFFYSKLEDLKVEMLGLATKNAYERAKSMAKSTNQGIGYLRKAQMGVFQITSATSTEVSDYGINDTSSRDKKVTAVVNATFNLR
jgi:hypothetical protein